LSYDAAGSLTKGHRGYEYEYDYENRIVKITKDPNDTVVAEYAYDALGRRIEKKDVDANETTRYYYNYNWQVLAEYDGSDTLQRIFIYGNYIDEVLLMKANGNDYYYAHDHLYSPAALVNSSGTVLERYEYDAYGKPTIWNAGFTTERDSSNYGNPYLFTGRRVDILDSGSLKIQYNRNRYYDYYSGRWLTHDPLGITPNPQKLNKFDAMGQYKDRMNLYEYVGSQPVDRTDPHGLVAWPPPDPVEPPEPPGGGPLFLPPSLEKGGSTFGGSWTCCPNAQKAINVANTVMTLNGPCAEWFELHGSMGEKYKVNIKCSLLSPFPAGTWPLTNDIYVAQWACKKDPVNLASLLIHEMAHHYCPPLIIDWDACPNSAQKACIEEVSDKLEI